jgi:hypothetical protein
VLLSFCRLMVAVAFVTLLLGVLGDRLAWVLASMACSVAAGLALYLLARRHRRVAEDLSTGALGSG